MTITDAQKLTDLSKLRLKTESVTEDSLMSTVFGTYKRVCH